MSVAELMFWGLYMALTMFLVGWYFCRLHYKVGTPSTSNNSQSDAIALCHDIAMRLSGGQPVTPHCDLHDRLNAVLAQQHT